VPSDASDPARGSTLVPKPIAKGVRGLALVFLSVCVLRGTASQAGSAGSAGANFLEFGQGPRAIGMGESQVAVAEDAYAAYWNPAGLAAVEHAQLALTYNKALEGVDQQYISLAYPLRQGSTLNLNFTRLGMSSFQGYDAQGVQTKSVGASDYALGAAYGRTLIADLAKRPVLNLGFNVKGIRESLDTESASAFAVDLGAIAYWRPGRVRTVSSGQEWRLGLAAKNLGPGLKFDRDRSDLPSSYQIGLAWRGYPKGDSLTLSLDQVLSRDEPHYIAAGVEYVVLRTVALRLGYKTGQEVGSGFRAGAGFKLKVFDLDYAFAGFGDLGQMHRVGLSIRLAGPVEVTPPDDIALEAILRKAARLMSERRFYEAILEYDKALDIDRGNTQALEGMKRANQALQP